MRKPVFFLTLPLAAWLLAPGAARALEFPDWVPVLGKKTPAAVAATSGEESTAAGEMQQAEAAEARGDAKEAIAGYKRVVKLYSLTAVAPKAQFKLGRLLENQGDYKAAADAYEKYTTKYPHGSEFDTVIQSQFNIAKLYLDGRKKKILGIPLAPSYMEAEKRFSGIVARAPFHKLAPMAQFNAGLALEKQGKNPEAMGAYQAVITRYPNDPAAAAAQYQMGFVQFREAKEGSNDPDARRKARESFEDFTIRYPQSEKVAQAQENLKALSGTDIKAALETAKYYDKTKNYKAAVVYYNDVVRDAPNTPESQASLKRIKELETLVGADALRSGPQKAQSGDIAAGHRRALARVDVASRPDYNGPAIDYPYPTVTNRPALRTAPVGPIVEPPLPSGDPLAPVPGLPGTTPPGVDPLLSPPNLPPPPDAAPKPNDSGGSTPSADKPVEKPAEKPKKPAKGAQ